jgi:hypothetical protein
MLIRDLPSACSENPTLVAPGRSRYLAGPAIQADVILALIDGGDPLAEEEVRQFTAAQ